MLPKPKIVFLYSEIAGYFLACAEELAKTADVLIVRWPINKEAPFEFNISKNITIICKSDYDNEALSKVIRDFKPTKIVCSGWMDKDYLSIVKQYYRQIPTILTLDNHWVGSLKQHIASLLSPFLIRNKFTHAWVPGKPQTKFAKKLGFKNITTGFYCADVALHEANFDSNKIMPVKQFLYVGRYVKHKSIFEMWEAFTTLSDAGKLDGWEMICAGTGEAFEARTKHAKIKHLGFIQPKDLKELVNKKPIYILPSSFEPWGVSVQEFAIAGCPLMISENVGAAELFLAPGKNGISIQPSVDSIKQAMLSFADETTNRLKEMGQYSNKLGTSYTPALWAEKLLAIKL
ncbi:glycosyl transferase family 1 [Putridiphycobacter roseus]|uniref:Glycosyl transferase family 1 n=1 Tax=Putridiphycobacter roseus TaxID=2219161 RepID=A0A2W1NLV9_9FLAO|nr:glycosyltransferase [Putridiphycobacter roseus]PZE15718.1 glycosyl transferase family 1 [Putridiphycobacter roseus]